MSSSYIWLCDEMLRHLRSLQSVICSEFCGGYHKDICTDLRQSIKRYESSLADPKGGEK